jgi:hypothetical protein
LNFSHNGLTASLRKDYESLLTERDLTRRLGREAQFEEHLELLRLEYERKRTFMKLPNGIE